MRGKAKRTESRRYKSSIVVIKNTKKRERLTRINGRIRPAQTNVFLGCTAHAQGCSPITYVFLTSLQTTGIMFRALKNISGFSYYQLFRTIYHWSLYNRHNIEFITIVKHD